MMEDDKVLYIFIDKHLIRSLYRHAKNTLEIPAEKLAEYFRPTVRISGSKGIIRHLKGHADHMHVRFHAPDSIAAIKEYVRRHGRKVLKPLPSYARIRSGDSLWRIARRHRVTVKKLLRWNRISRRKILRPGKKLIVGWRRPRYRLRGKTPRLGEISSDIRSEKPISLSMLVIRLTACLSFLRASLRPDHEARAVGAVDHRHPPETRFAFCPRKSLMTIH